MSKLSKIFTLVFALSILPLAAAAAPSDKNREEYSSLGDFAENFCGALPRTLDGLLGALTSSDVFFTVYQMPEAKLQSMSDEKFESLFNDAQANSLKKVPGSEYSSCKNKEIKVFDCYRMYRILSTKLVPKKATQEEKDYSMYKITQAGEYFGATRTCGSIAMNVKFSGKDKKNKEYNIVTYLNEDDGTWHYLLID